MKVFALIMFLVGLVFRAWGNVPFRNKNLTFLGDKRGSPYDSHTVAPDPHPTSPLTRGVIIYFQPL